MPRFTLIKHADNEYDCEVTVSFEAELLGLAKGHFDDFLKASGFEIPLESDGRDSAHMFSEWLDESEDALWNDAFASKFRNDGPVGADGADVLPFPVSDS